jgi:hypothetical protein
MAICRKCNRYVPDLNPEGYCRKCAQRHKNMRRVEEFSRRNKAVTKLLVGDIGG